MAGQYHAYLPNLSSSTRIQDRRSAFENIRNIQPGGMIPHEVGLSPGGLLNSVSQVINQVTSDMNPNNYPYNVVGSIPAFQPNVTSGPLGNRGYIDEGV